MRVVARHKLNAYIPDTEIVVQIPEGTTGQVVREWRNQVVIVQFDVPSLPPLRVDRNDLISADSLEVLLSEMESISHAKSDDRNEKMQSALNVLLRTLRVLSDEENHQQIEQMIRLFNQIQKIPVKKPKKD